MNFLLQTTVNPLALVWLFIAVLGLFFTIESANDARRGVKVSESVAGSNKSISTIAKAIERMAQYRVLYFLCLIVLGVASVAIPATARIGSIATRSIVTAADLLLLEAFMFLAVATDRVNRGKIFQKIREEGALPTSGSGIIVVNNEEIIVNLNASAEKILGYDRSDLVGHTVSSTLIPPELRGVHFSGFMELINPKSINNNGVPVMIDYKIPVVRGDGSRVTLNVRANRVDVVPPMVVAAFSVEGHGHEHNTGVGVTNENQAESKGSSDTSEEQATLVTISPTSESRRRFGKTGPWILHWLRHAVALSSSRRNQPVAASGRRVQATT